MTPPWKMKPSVVVPCSILIGFGALSPANAWLMNARGCNSKHDTASCQSRGDRGVISPPEAARYDARAPSWALPSPAQPSPAQPRTPSQRVPPARAQSVIPMRAPQHGNKALKMKMSQLSPSRWTAHAPITTDQSPHSTAALPLQHRRGCPAVSPAPSPSKSLR